LIKCGVVELNVKVLPKLFKQEVSGQYKEVLRRYVENESDGKTWGYHPREQRLKDAALAKRQSWWLQQKTEAKTNTTNRRNYQNTVKPMGSGSYTKNSGRSYEIKYFSPIDLWPRCGLLRLSFC
jgi:hypothetical protein